MIFIIEFCFFDIVISYKNRDQTKLLHKLNIDIFVIRHKFSYMSEYKNTKNLFKKILLT